MRILIITDAWKPQINGVVRTYESLVETGTALGHDFHIIGPSDFPIRAPIPFYREIELAFPPPRQLLKMIKAYQPDTIHIATEGPLGKIARRLCLKHKWPFTTCYHTQFPDYAAARAAKYLPFLYKPVRNHFVKLMRNFHKPSSAMMVATQSLKDELLKDNFNVAMPIWARGVYVDIFKPAPASRFNELTKPVALFVGRVAIEKNIEAFLDMPWQGSKVVVGAGPSLDALKRKYPFAHFIGKQMGHDLAACYQSSDIFVFPSKTDTFGMVIVEALACGLPVAAYDVIGPRDIIVKDYLGYVGDDLADNAKKALNTGSKEQRHNYIAAHYSWESITNQFIQIIIDNNALMPSDAFSDNKK
jgi:glycosyltransferase involved in cell wall biosynthesis